jgi:ABC-type multidrug transport system ATPase subunit
MSIAIQLKEITKTFKNFTAVNGLNLQVNKGDIYGFLGPNGSGKSTTLRLMMGLIKPSSGEINLFGKSLANNRSEIMKKVGCMIEKPDFYGYLNAKENLELVARASLLSYSKKQYSDLFELVGLLGREKDKVKTFSHGMKQRLGLAQTLIHNPELIILDEPNTGLDPQGIIDLRQLMLMLNKEQGKTIVFSSHILSEVQEICTSMVVINKGKAVVEGKVADLLSQENLHVVVETSDMNALRNYMQNSTWHAAVVSESNSEMHLQLAKKDIPLLSQEIIKQNIPLLRIDYRNQLEEYFLRITKE